MRAPPGRTETADPQALVSVLALTQGLQTPSARFRVRAFVDGLLSHGLAVHERPLAIHSESRFDPGKVVGRSRTLAGVVRHMIETHWHDVTWMQRQLIPRFMTLEGWTHRPRVLDVDDAIFLYRDGRMAPRLARFAVSCETVVCGNPSLADWFQGRGANVTIIPTVVDTDALGPRPEQEGPLRLGWIGTGSNLGYLEGIQSSIGRALRRHPKWSLRVVSNRRPELPSIPTGRWEFIPWSQETEAALLQSFAIGLMPLPDDSWTRGKCGFKLLQYMAVGVPAVASPVGVNEEILGDEEVGLAASSASEWDLGLGRLMANPGLRADLGRRGREKVVAEFSVRVAVPRIARVLRSATQAKGP